MLCTCTACRQTLRCRDSGLGKIGNPNTNFCLSAAHPQWVGVNGNIKPDKNINSPRGRFAPSPTGALHFGSLIAATASYLATKQDPDGKWLLRIEDVDTQREQDSASQSIIKTLESFGFTWDGEILYQSHQNEKYQAGLDSISSHIYPCSCTRKYLQSLL